MRAAIQTTDYHAIGRCIDTAQIIRRIESIIGRRPWRPARGVGDEF